VTERLTLIVATALLAAIGLLPVAGMLGLTVTGEGGFNLNAYRALFGSHDQLGVLMGHSLQLSLLTASISMLIGVPLGILLGKTDLPLRGSLTLLFAMPLLPPPYVLAIAWFSIVGRSGFLGGVLPDAWSQRISSAFFGLPGCTFVLASAFAPLAMLLTIAFLQTVNPRLEHAGRLVGGWSGVLRRITLPLVAPALAFVAVLIFLLALGEIGVPMYLRFSVYPVEVLTQFAAFYDFRSATIAAVPLFVLTLAIVGLQSGLYRRVLQLGRRTPSEETAQIRLGAWQFPLLVIVLTLALFLVALPLGALAVQSSSPAVYAVALNRAGDSVLRSIAFAAAGATLLAFLGFFWGYLAQRRTLAIWWLNEWLALLFFALPGSVNWHWPDRPVEHQANEFHLREPSHSHPGLPHPIRDSSNARYIGFPHCCSGNTGGGGAAKRRRMDDDLEAHRRSTRQQWHSCGMADQLRVLVTRCCD
jgi:ABC-type Fe3+ transport system permease subunit